LAHALANVANNCVVMKPHLVKAIEDPFTRQKELTTPKESYRLQLKPENIEVIKKAMIEVNRSGTSAAVFKDAAYQTGGKPEPRKYSASIHKSISILPPANIYVITRFILRLHLLKNQLS